MKDSDRLLIQVGDTVRVADDNGVEAEYEVKWAPWLAQGGVLLIGLRGICGGYPLARVQAILAHANTPPDPSADPFLPRGEAAPEQ